MADSYCETSFKIPFEDTSNIEVAGGVTFEAEVEKDGIWIHGENIDVTELVEYLESLLGFFRYENPVIFTYAVYCNKPHIGSFSGGAVRVQRGKETVVGDAEEFLVKLHGIPH